MAKSVPKKAAIKKATPKKAIKKTASPKKVAIKKGIKKVAKKAIPKKKTSIKKQKNDILLTTYGTGIKIKNSEEYEIQIQGFWLFEQYKYDFVDNILTTMDLEFPSKSVIKWIAEYAGIYNSEDKLITNLSHMNGSAALDFLNTYLLEQSKDSQYGIGTIDGSTTKLGEGDFFDVVFNGEDGLEEFLKYLERIRKYLGKGDLKEYDDMIKFLKEDNPDSTVVIQFRIYYL